jgi:hypothetical protein
MAEITNELLKQAIADAEAVRQTAIANAKIALEETFTPQIKSMLAKRLRAEAMEATEGAEKAKEEPFQDADAVGGNTPVDTSAIGTGDNKEPSDAANYSSDIDQGGEGETDSSTDWYDDWSESDFDLDEVIKELEEDVKALSEAEEEEKEEELDEAKHEGEEKEEMKEGMYEDDKEEGEEHGEEEKADEAAKVVDATKDAGTPPEAAKKHSDAMQKKGDDKPNAPAVNPMGKMEMTATDASDPHKFAMNPAEPKMEMGMDNGYGAGEGEEELDLEAILRELEAQDEKDKEQKHQMASKMANLQKELAEYRKVVEVLRGKLNEVNLLNAKLLYTNKIFRKEGLTNEQKVSILESFDRAINVREVKMVYTTLAETMTVTAKSGKSRTSSSKVVTEGLASKPTPSTAPKKEILEENTVAKRLQQLAGIL